MTKIIVNSFWIALQLISLSYGSHCFLPFIFGFHYTSYVISSVSSLIAETLSAILCVHTVGFGILIKLMTSIGKWPLMNILKIYPLDFRRFFFFFSSNIKSYLSVKDSCRCQIQNTENCSCMVSAGDLLSEIQNQYFNAGISWD